LALFLFRARIQRTEFEIKSRILDPLVNRIEGKRYRRRLERVEDEFLISRLAEEVRDKYTSLPSSDPSEVWFFHLAPES
jgi:hypothetical protein